MRSPARVVLHYFPYLNDLIVDLFSFLSLLVSHPLVPANPIGCTVMTGEYITGFWSHVYISLKPLPFPPFARLASFPHHMVVVLRSYLQGYAMVHGSPSVVLVPFPFGSTLLMV